MNKDKEVYSEKINSILTQKYVELMHQFEENLLNILSDMKNKKKSIYIIVSLLNGIDFHGFSTRTIYEAYHHLCLQNNIQNLLSDVEFSRFICKRFGYEVVDKKRKGKKYRVFRKVQDDNESSRWVQDAVQDETQ